MNQLSISLVALTFNRKDCVDELLTSLKGLAPHVVETIVVDNGSSDGTGELVCRNHPDVVLVQSSDNLGACGRNLGIERATSDIVITLDDDVFGITPEDLDHIRASFDANPRLVALNFRVVDYFSKQLCNWVHHRPATDAGGKFATYEITEGAVAFRTAAVREQGGYWPRFFIGHEGPDLAFRLMDAGGEIAYDGSITVLHKHEATGRLSWRFYYYDTRNQIWLAARRMHVRMAARYLFIGLNAMAFYALRDGFVRWWWRAVYDGLRGLREVWSTRAPMTRETEQAVREIDRSRPGFWSQAWRRLTQPANRLDA